MSKNTSIEWSDSTLNLEMGCDGCELWNPQLGVRQCYAGTMTGRYAGRKGYPDRFEQPVLYLDRLETALRWRDLIGTDRPDKPWLNGRPRMVFLNDMGDTFTESLPIDWLAPIWDRLSASPHHWMILTKRPSRMRRFLESHGCPANVWPGASITTAKTLRRLDELCQIVSNNLFLSIEPLSGPIEIGDALAGVALVILGGASGPDADACDVQWLRSLVGESRRAKAAVFVKQLGSRPYVRGVAGEPDWPAIGRIDFQTVRIYAQLRDPKGGDPSEWPADLRVRQFPKVSP